ncbi:MAG: hypothetical protein HYY53_05075 [candidate division NC10 bacterium]|nr:hypothetical protein [candidate division NC10 bacterium]
MPRAHVMPPRRRPAGRSAGPRPLLAGLLAAGFTALTGVAHAQGPLTLQAHVILASNQGQGVDKAIEGIGGELRKIFRYSRYQLLTRVSGRAALKEAWRAPLPGGRTLQVTPLTVQDGLWQVGVKILRGSGPSQESLLTSTVRLQSGGSVLLAGPPHDQGILVIALSAH